MHTVKVLEESHRTQHGCLETRFQQVFLHHHLAFDVLHLMYKYNSPYVLRKYDAMYVYIYFMYFYVRM